MTQQVTTTTRARKIGSGIAAAILAVGLAVGGVTALLSHTIQAPDIDFEAMTVLVEGSGAGFDGGTSHTVSPFWVNDEVTTFTVTNTGNTVADIFPDFGVSEGAPLNGAVTAQMLVDGDFVFTGDLDRLGRDYMGEKKIATIAPGEAVEVEFSFISQADYESWDPETLDFETATFSPSFIAKESRD